MLPNFFGENDCRDSGKNDTDDAEFKDNLGVFILNVEAWNI